jgi:hypothetical protein
MSGVPWVALGLALNLLLTAALAASGELPILTYVLAGGLTVSVLGVVLACCRARLVGAIAIMIGAVVFFPLGLVVMFGARKVLDRLRYEAFLHRHGPRDGTVPAAGDGPLCDPLYTNAKVRNRTVLIGALLCLLGGVQIWMGSTGTAFGLGAALLGLAVWQACTPVFRLFTDHFEMQVTFLTPLHFVRYQDVVEVERGPRAIVVHVREANEVRKMRLPLQLLIPVDAADLLQHLENS